MQGKQTGRILLGISIGCFLLMSVSFLLMPAAILGILPGLLFWIGLILAGICQVMLEIQRRKFFTENHADRTKMQKPRCGLLTFGSNRYAKMADIAFLICLALSLMVFAITKGFGYICYIFISLTVFSFCMHCVLNGRNYFHVVHHDTVLKAIKMQQKRPANKERAKKRRGAFER